MTDRVTQLQGKVAKIRRADISPELASILSAVGDELNVYFEVTSGGQNAKTGRTGSHRHDDGNSADLKAYTLNSDGSKHYLDQSNDADRAVWSNILKLSVAGGAKGIGAGPDYMGNLTAHIGFGKPAAWGAGGKVANAEPWVTEAFKAGQRTPPLNIPQVGSLTDTARSTPPTPQIRPASLSVPSQVPLPTPRPSPPSVPAAMQMFAPGRKQTSQEVADMYGGMGLTAQPTAPKVRVISVNPDGTEVDSKPSLPQLPPGRVPALPTTAEIRKEARADQRQPLPTVQPGMLGRVSPPTSYGTRDPLSIYYKPPATAQITAPVTPPVSRDISGPTAAQQKVIDGGYYALHPDEKPAVKAPALTMAQRNALAATSLPAAQPTYQPGMTGRGLPVTTAPVPVQRPISQPATQASAPIPRYRPTALPTVPVPRISAPAALPLSNFNTVNPMSQIVPRVQAQFNTSPMGHLFQAATGQPVQGGLLSMFLGGGNQSRPQLIAPPTVDRTAQIGALQQAVQHTNNPELAAAMAQGRTSYVSSDASNNGALAMNALMPTVSISGKPLRNQ